MEFFKPDGYYPNGHDIGFFELWIPIIISFLIIVILVKYSKQIKTNPILKKWLDGILLGLLIFAQLGSWMVTILYRDGTFFGFTKHDAPLHLCSISLLALIYIIIAKKNYLHKLLFYGSLFGAVLGMVFSYNTITVGIKNFEYWRFFIAHLSIFVGYIYYQVANDNYLTAAEGRQSIAFFYALLTFMLIFNLIFGTQYIYLGPVAYENIGLFQMVPNWIYATVLVYVIVAIYAAPCFAINSVIQKKTRITE